jgi:hypothetical protein
VITTVELFTPGLGLLAKGGLTVAEAYLAGGTGTAADSKYAKFTLESIEEVEKAGHAVRHVAKGGGKFLTISGFYFDVEEVPRTITSTTGSWPACHLIHHSRPKGSHRPAGRPPARRSEYNALWSINADTPFSNCGCAA